MSVNINNSILIQVTDIKLDEPDETVYHPGDVISGRLIVTSVSDEVQQVCELSIRMQGKATTMWTGGVMPSSHTGHETYLDYVQFLHRQDGTKMIISPGALLEFPFNITLPDQKVPCSYLGPHGCIRYALRGVLIPEPTATQEKEEVDASYVDKDINVFSEYDVSTCPGWNDPIEILWSNEISNCCLALFKKTLHPFKFSLYSPKSGYTTGEMIDYVVKFDNKSNHKTPEIFINFIQKTTFVADDKSEKEGPAKTIALQKGPIVPPGKNVEEHFNFVVPEESLPTRLGGCSLIQYEYFIEVEIDLDTKNLATIRGTVLIGSVNKSI